MKWFDSILGRPPQLPDTKPQIQVITPPEQVLDWVAAEVNADRLCLSIDARRALARVNAAVAQQDRRMVGK